MGGERDTPHKGTMSVESSGNISADAVPLGDEEGFVVIEPGPNELSLQQQQQQSKDLRLPRQRLPRQGVATQTPASAPPSSAVAPSVG